MVKMQYFYIAIKWLKLCYMVFVKRVKKHSIKNRKLLSFWVWFCLEEKKLQIGWKVELKLLPLCASRYRSTIH
jgi:hypothetical protein